MNGIINFFKPKGITSHDAVNLFRKLLDMKRIGHTGTLDPNVTGVLPICIGKATRVSEYLIEADKEYISEVTLGFETDTQDIDGEILRSSKKRVSNKEIVETFNKFHGDINQTPPMYSAVRYKGKKLYELARKNVIVKREPRSVRIETLDIIKNQNNKKIIFKTECSKGTYIRTLCNDIGRTLGTYGYMSYLIRTGVGEFRIEDSLSVDYLKLIDRENIENLILPMDKALNNLDKIILEEKYYKPITNGVMVEIQDKNDYDLNNNLKVYCRGKFIGIGRILIKDEKYYIKMNKVLI